MTKKIFTGLIISLLVMLNANSQPLFYSQSLQKLYYSLPQSCRLENPVSDTVVFCNGILQGLTVPVAYSVDSYGMLAHVGYRFLPDSIETQFFNLAVVRFLEREALALLAADNLDQKLTNNRENGLTLLHNGNTPRREFYRNRNGLPDLLQRVSGMDIRYDERRSYNVDLSCGQGQSLTFIFKADAELMSDMDKKERDEQLMAQLMVHRSKSVSVPQHIPACDNASMQIFSDSLYICQGRSYIIPQMNNSLYYLKTNSTTFELVFNKNWFSESLSNVLLASVGSDYNVRIVHRQYGGVVQRYEMKISDFNDYFTVDYDRYFGIETPDRDVLKGTLILVDRNVGNIHLAFVSINIWNLLNGGVMEMQLDTNIPQHNVETLFDKMKERDNNTETYKVNIK